MSPLDVHAQVDALADLYSRRADAYDALWSPFIRPAGEQLLSRLPLAGARKVLDVGTGTGALLPSIRRAAPAATVFGIDRSPGMLALARSRHDGPLSVMDAQRLEFPSDEFDVAVLAFILFHLPDPQRCLREVARVLRPGGTVGTVTWSREEGPTANEVWEQELSAAGARPIELPATENEGCCDSVDKVTRLLEGAGFANVSSWSEPVEHRWSVADHFTWHLAGKSGVRLLSLTAAERRACLDRIRHRLAWTGADGFQFRGEVVLATASR